MTRSRETAPKPSPRIRIFAAAAAWWLPLAAGPALAQQPGERVLVPDYGEVAERERAVDLLHSSIDVRLDIPEETISGAVTHQMRVLRERITEVEIDAEELLVFSASVDGRKTPFRTEKSSIIVELPRPFEDGEELSIRLEYEGKSPSRGVFFRHAQDAYPGETDVAFTQGQSEDTHFWVPIYDKPNDRATWETRLTVREDLTAVSNGRLVSVEPAGPGYRTFHHALEQPNATYLIAFAVGPWERYADDWNGVAVEYFVNRGVGEATARRSFGETPDMMEFFARYTKEPYPWPKYAQVAVPHFVTGGMENTGCTLQNDGTLHDEIAHLERDSTGLVAHELAHQWFGDLVTCRTWEDLWLNEGFATYFEALWLEHRRGLDEARIDMWRNQQSFKRADGDQPRAMVADFFSRSGSRANAHVYSKGASVLHMLRFVLGDHGFRKSLALYLDRHRMGSVQTRDFQLAIADATGRNLEWFFEQWVYLAGHPKFQVRFDYDAANSQGTLHVAQTQEVGGLVPVFRTPVDVEFVVDGESRVHRIFVEEKEQTFSFSLPSRPTRVRFDKGGWILKDLEFERPLEERIEQALSDDDVIGRLEAVLALKDDRDPRALDALVRVAQSSDHHRVRTEALEGIAARDGDTARDALLRALFDPEARVRRAAAGALSKYKGDREVAKRLFDVLREERAYRPRAAAIRSLARIEADGAFEAIEAQLDVRSDREQIARAALGALLDLDAVRAVPHVLRLAAPGVVFDVRHDALGSFGRVAAHLDSAGRSEAIELARGALLEPLSRTRGAALSALAGLVAREALEDVERVARSDNSRRVRAQAERAAEQIRKGEIPKTDPLADLKKRLEELGERVEKLEAVGGDG